MTRYNTLIFWLGVGLLLTVFFSTTLESWIIAFYFVAFLLPVVIGTSLFFNRLLVPRYLLRGYWKSFVLYFFYLLIVSIYLELLVMVASFVILADYQIQNLGKIAGDIYLLTLVLYFVVFLEGMVITIRKLRQQSSQLSAIEQKLERNRQEFITIRENRKHVPVVIQDILYVESLSDYVKIHTAQNVHMTKERISVLSEKVPDTFLRVHRSFLVNRQHISSYGKEKVVLGNVEIPIGRKYGKSVAEKLREGLTAGNTSLPKS